MEGISIKKGKYRHVQANKVTLQRKHDDQSLDIAHTGRTAI
jgi:hypothetical protein